MRCWPEEVGVVAKGVGGEGRGGEVEQRSTGAERGRGAAKGAIRRGGILYYVWGMQQSNEAGKRYVTKRHGGVDEVGVHCNERRRVCSLARLVLGRIRGGRTRRTWVIGAGAYQHLHMNALVCDNVEWPIKG